MKNAHSIYLIGPGKPAVAKRLAKQLELEFHDSDEEIESRTGVDMPFIFDKEGEAACHGARHRCIRLTLHHEDCP